MSEKLEPNILIKNIAKQISELALPQPLIVGIHTGGVWVAEQLHHLTENQEQLCTLDISFYRDDFSRVGLNPEVRASNLPVSVEGRNILLVDDVLHTGRTIRAALAEIFSYGRPATVILCTLIDRSGRELPIQADIVGKKLSLKSHENIKLTMKNGKLYLNIRTAECPQ